jgi:hypothetical protein
MWESAKGNIGHPSPHLYTQPPVRAGKGLQTREGSRSARLGERSASEPGGRAARGGIIGLPIRPAAAPRAAIRFVPHASAALASQVDRGVRFDHQSRPQMTALGAAPVAHQW